MNKRKFFTLCFRYWDAADLPDDGGTGLHRAGLFAKGNLSVVFFPIRPLICPASEGEKFMAGEHVKASECQLANSEKKGVFLKSKFPIFQ